jgi:hypothetical protein
LVGNVTLDETNELDEKVIEKNEEGKIKEFHVTNPTQLLALLHLVRTTIFAQDILFVFHSLTALLISEKVCHEPLSFLSSCSDTA